MKSFLLAVFMAITALSVIPLSGCGTDKIGDILADPLRYEGEEVRIKGYVGETLWLSLLDKGAYEVGDGNGRTIWVTTSQPPPQEGEKISVRGTVSTAVKIGDRTLGTVIKETRRN